jgi:hypothetical protein
MAKTSPTQRSLKHLRDQGYFVAVVEKWNPHARIRQDLFNVFDLLALPTKESGNAAHLLAVQVTSRANMASRIKKIMSQPEAEAWCICGGLIEVHGWDKYKNRWRIKAVEMSLVSDGGWMTEERVYGDE